MKKIAILTSGEGKITKRLASLFNEGNSIRVELVLSDQVPDRIIDDMLGRGINALCLPRIIWDTNPIEIIKLIDDSGAELLVLDDFKGGLPAEIAAKYEGRIVAPENEEEAPGNLLAALSNLDGDNAEKCWGASCESKDGEQVVEETVKESSVDGKTTDEEWAETLKIKFDQQQVNQTPPPIPSPFDSPSGGRFDGSGYQGNQANQGYQASQGYRANQSYQNHQSYQSNQGYQNNQGNQEAMPSTYLIWSILCTIFCCFVPGIVAIIFSSQVSSKYYIGDIEGSKRASHNAEIWIIVSFVLGVLTATLYLPIMLLT